MKMGSATVGGWAACWVFSERGNGSVVGPKWSGMEGGASAPPPAGSMMQHAVAVAVRACWLRAYRHVMLGG